jgi:hypothetical protein
MTAQRTRKAGTGRKPVSRGGTAVGVLVFAVFVAGIVAWIVFGRPASAENAAGARVTGTSGTGAAASSSAEAPTDPPAPSAAPEPSPAPIPASTPASAKAAIEIPPGSSAESVFLDVVAESGLAPPATDDETLAMARDVCAALDGGMSRPHMTQVLIHSGATAAEAENFIDLATATICPQHASA